MHALVTDFNGMVNIGLYAFVNDNFALIGSEISEEVEEQMKEVFQVPIHRVTLAGTSLIGVFTAGNNHKIMIPGITFDHEREHLRKLGINFVVFDTKLTGLGNNILMDDNCALVNPDFSDADVKKIDELMNVKTQRAEFTEVTTVGNLAVLNKSRGRALVSNDLNSEELRLIENTFKIKAIPGSVNMGSPFIRAGTLVNAHGFAMGSASGGPELANADEALGFLEDE
ncbi:MAG: translation initiation factor IF-6 [Candidatus Woesearchaeota archaeon]|jgi:translation initiation factor 6